MYRQLTLSACPILRTSSLRTFSTTARTMAEGDAAKGGAQGDAFSKREKANEDYAIRMREKEKLQELKRAIAQQHEHLDKLTKHLEDTDKARDEKK